MRGGGGAFFRSRLTSSPSRLQSIVGGGIPAASQTRCLVEPTSQILSCDAFAFGLINTAGAGNTRVGSGSRDNSRLAYNAKKEPKRHTIATITQY